MCSLGIAGLPHLPWDFLHQYSRNFLFLHRITVSGLIRYRPEFRSCQGILRQYCCSRQDGALWICDGACQTPCCRGLSRRGRGNEQNKSQWGEEMPC